MRPFEYLLLLAAVILGLALSDIALSTHRLLSAWERIKWDWMAPVAATLAFVKILTQWWVWFTGEELAGKFTFEMFAGLLVSAGLLFLMAAASLPDEVGERGVDLRTHYAAVSRRYWILFALHFVVANAVVIWAQMRIEHANPSLARLFIQLAILPLAVLPMIFRQRWLHGTALVGLLSFYVWQELGRSITV